jgi:hypothetical protein
MRVPEQLQAATPDDTPRWNFEGTPFRLGAPTNGNCEGTKYLRPVHRFYNRGFERGIDSNHRYVVDDAALVEISLRGWVYEGVVFCALLG